MSAALCMSALDDREYDVPSFYLRTMPDNDEPREATETLAPPTDREAPTSPAASERPAIAPPSKLPDDAELGASQLASHEPPAWWEGSFIGQALGQFAGDADDIRKGRAAQHGEQMAAIRGLGTQLGTFDQKLVRFGQRMTRVENDVRDLRNDMVREREHALDRDRDVHEFKSLMTAMFIRMEMFEKNGNGEKQLAGLRVLVVEDEEQLQRTLRRMLEKEGSSVVAAANWEEVTDSIGSDIGFDFVIVDIRLEGEDGFQIAEWLIAKGNISASRVILMTGDITSAHTQLTGELGLRILQKPFGATDVLRTIRETLDTAEPTEAPAKPE
jgi:CheY-like chemotaxis protein